MIDDLGTIEEINNGLNGVCDLLFALAEQAEGSFVKADGLLLLALVTCELQKKSEKIMNEWCAARKNDKSGNAA